MVENMLRQKLQKEKEVVFTFYNLDYCIKKENKKIVIYPLFDNKRKKYYKSLDELLYYYNVYNENIKENINRIKIL